MAAPTYVSKAETTGGSYSGGINLQIPSGVATDDILVASVVSYGNSEGWLTPSGWTLKSYKNYVTADFSRALFWKRRTSGDTAGATVAVEYTNNTNTHYSLGAITAFRGAAASGDPWNVSTDVDMASESSNVTAMPTASVTTSAGNCLLIYEVWAANTAAATMTPPSGFTMLNANPTGNAFAVKTQTSAGASGSVAGSWDFAGKSSVFLGALAATSVTLSVAVTTDDSSLLTSETANLTATPTGGSGSKTYSWTKTSGPTTSFGTASAATTTFTPTGGAGTYILRCTVTDAIGPQYDEVTITVAAPSDYVVPTAVNVSTGWTPTGGTHLAVVSDSSGATFDTSSANPSGLEYTVTMDALVAPTGSNDLTVLVDIDKLTASTGTFVAKLYEGATLRSTVSGLSIPTGSAAADVSGQVTVTFPSAAIAAVTSWAALKVTLLVTAAP